MADPVDYGDPPVEPSPPVLEQIYTYWDMKSVRDFGCPADPDQRKQPPPKWPPEDGYGIDAFNGLRPAGITINPNMNRLYQRRRRAQRNHPSTLFEDVSKNRFKRALELAKDSGLNCKRIAGHGGYGLAAIFDTSSIEPQYKSTTAPKFVVVKFSMQPDVDAKGVQKEKEHMDKMRRAEHIVKRILPQDLYNATGWAKYGAAPNVFDEDTTPGGFGQALVMEYMELGTLEQQLIRLNTINRDPTSPDGGRRLQDEECWRMLECLVKACVALKYPPILQPQVNGIQLPADGANIHETIPPPGWREDRNIIHFDIAPDNIFVGAWPVQNPAILPPSSASATARLAHQRAPPFKIGDLGLAEEWTDADVDDSDQAWFFRSLAKQNFFRPEQYTIEWDCYSGNPIDGEPKHPRSPFKKPESQIAARYSEKTNIYDVGLAMHCVLTGAAPPTTKPWAEMAWITPPLSPAEGVKVPERWMGRTHGWRLREGHDENIVPTRWQSISTRLKEVVMQCLMHEPSQRPSLEALLKEVTKQVEGYTGATGIPDAALAFTEPLPVQHTVPVPTPAPLPPNVPVPTRVLTYQPQFENGPPAHVQVGTQAWHDWPGSDVQNLVDEMRNRQYFVGVGEPTAT